MRGHNIWFQREMRNYPSVIIKYSSDLEHKNLCCDPLYLNRFDEMPSLQDHSDEGSQHMASKRNKKNYPSIFIK